MEIQMKEQRIEELKKKLPLPKFMVLLGSIILVLTLIVPFASANEDYKEYLEDYPNEKYGAELNMTNKEAINLSLVEYGKVYYEIYEMGIDQDICMVSLGTIAVFGVFAILTLLFSILKRSTSILICSSLALIVFRILKWDFMDRGVVPSSYYDSGIATYFCHIGVIVTIIGVIMLFITKVKEKNKSCGG